MTELIENDGKLDVADAKLLLLALKCVRGDLGGVEMAFIGKTYSKQVFCRETKKAFIQLRKDRGDSDLSTDESSK